ncbi:hypothetical protein L1987_19567 [Smallanthus sonchifolius]|uniref:Uncharacterized protein n=1 Tax=Smallanthus sonchifolius TaxID=185202 RepID=A0ACB9IPF6_9ASTR|nr:hypothetical protein L1987_19567 [Smallanthus sonchifolius]
MATSIWHEYSDAYTDEEQEDDEEEQEYNHERTHSTFSSRGRATLDPRAPWVHEWNRVFLLVCVMGLFVDPLFFYTLSISESSMCVYIDGWLAVLVTALRCMTDALHVWNMWLHFKMNRWWRSSTPLQLRFCTDKTTARTAVPRLMTVAKNHYLFDVFVILPIPQVVLWVVIPALLQKGSSTFVMTVFLIMFLFQFLPKIYHFVCLLRRMQSFSGYVFRTVCWGIALNLIAYFVASHAVGACWYLLGTQRAAKCLKEKCMETNGCKSRILTCEEFMYYGTKGTFGNLESTTDGLEVVFIILVLTTGLLLVTMLIGNIKVFLHSITSKKQAMQLKMRNLEWWMSRKHLPQVLRQRVRNYERQRWAAMRGVNECEMIRDLPEGLRRDIKYHLCLDLVRQVPLFQHMDSLVLENICDRVKPLIFTKKETITREGDPVQRMLFIVRGHLQSNQILRDGVKSCCMLGPGNFIGDELLSWCLKRPFVERLPPSSSTLVTLETTEAFGLDAEDVKYVTQHFRYTFVNEKVKMSARYYSPGWRTWATVAIQLAWRRCKHRLTLTSLSFIRPRRPLSRCSSLGEDRLRLYTALLTSPKPN